MLFLTPLSAIFAAAVAPIAGLRTHMGIPVAIDRSTRSRGAPRRNSRRGRCTMASLAWRIPRERFVQACSRPSAAESGCTNSDAPRSTAVQFVVSGPSPPGPLVRSDALMLPRDEVAMAEPSDCMVLAAYSKAVCVPTKIRSVRSMLSTVTCLRKDTRPRRIAWETRLVPPPERYCFKGSRMSSAKPPPTLAMDRIGVTPVNDRRICVRLRSALQAATACAITWPKPDTPLTCTLWKATSRPSSNGRRFTSSHSSPRRRAPTSRRFAR
mmetsp:Transcript_22985/g.50798  ORF Transcript_22985/g.50798 Transcript_22985/m.50798 type:complete len:268 (-) Transcript_22985:57-860(-)